MTPYARPMAAQHAEASAVIGVVARADEYEALEGFLSALPSDCDAAFLVYAGLASTELRACAVRLSRRTSLSVMEVTDRTLLRQGGVYLLASEDDVTLDGHVLQVQPSTLRPAPRLGVERFAQSLCEDRVQKPLIVNLAHGFDEACSCIHVAGGIVLDSESRDMLCLSDADSLDPPSLARLAVHIATLRAPAQAPAQQLRAKSLELGESLYNAASERHSGVMPVARDVRSKPSSQIVLSGGVKAWEDAEPSAESEQLGLEKRVRELEEKRAELERLATKIYAANQQYQAQLQDLRSMLRVYRLAFEGLDSGVLFLGPRGEVMRYNRAALHAFALQPEHLGLAIDTLPRRFDYELLSADLVRVINLGEAVEVRVPREDGAWLLRFSPLMGEMGEVAGIVLTCTMLGPVQTG